jgi:hypothetical protein
MKRFFISLAVVYAPSLFAQDIVNTIATGGHF